MSETTDAPTGAESEPQDTQQGATPDDVAKLGEGGKKALSAEREARKAAEKTAAELKAATRQLAERLAKNPPAAIAGTKAADGPLEAGDQIDVPDSVGARA